MQPSELDYYRKPAPMSDAGARARLFDALPDDVPAIARTVPGLMLHQHLAGFYGPQPTSARVEKVHLRDVAAILDEIVAIDARPLTARRDVEKRLVGVCRHFTLLLVAMLRAKGYAARSRCGFATYFAPGHFVDHWVGEYWHEEEKRWVMVDAQIDDVLTARFKPDFDPLDVPPDRFVVAGDAWMRVRSGRDDPDLFGIMDLRGHWFIAGDVIRDVAALNKAEMLPWDLWGAMPPPNAAMNAKTFPLFDEMAALTAQHDTPLAKLQALYAPMRIPEEVFNSLLDRFETV